MQNFRHLRSIKNKEALMKIETFSLGTSNPDVKITAYIADDSAEGRRPALLIIPGGGYRICAYCEGEPYALEFCAKGYNCFVLGYSVMGAARFPSQLIEASLAMKFIRDNAEKYKTDKDRVFVIGSSAGGHLAAMLGTMWNDKLVTDAIDMPKGYNRPTGMLLCYPVITSDRKYAHEDSFRKLLGNENLNDDAMRKKVSIERAVTKKTVPAFIWHTRTDSGVPVMNSLLLAESLAKKNIPYELHIYPSGGHGMSLCQKNLGSENDYNHDWVRCATHWMRSFDK